MGAKTDDLVTILLEELVTQWAAAHFDHCGAWPHDEGKDCYWPLPDVARTRLTDEQIMNTLGWT